MLDIEKINYNPSNSNLNTFLNHINNFIDIARKNNLNFILVGHLSLILLSKKMYRDPSDIDILISIQEIDEWLEQLDKNEWLWHTNIITFNSLKLFKKFQLQKFASVDYKSCNINENISTLYEIKNGQFLTYSISKFTNKILPNIEDQPKWICHDPENLNNHNLVHVEKRDNLFKIWCVTNSVKKFYKTFIIFYDRDLKHKKLVELNFDHNSSKDNEVCSYWSSPFLDLNEFNNSYYRLFIYRSIFAIKFKHRHSESILDCYFGRENLSLDFKTEIIYSNNANQENNYLLSTFKNKELKISNPYFCIKSKSTDREKDLEDYKFYSSLIEEYPLTFQ
jgi:hypothetical protein